MAMDTRTSANMKFIGGIVMFIGGMFLLLKNLYVQYNFGWGTPMYRVGGMGINSGMILIPFLIGIGMLFFNSKNVWGWILAIGSLVLLILGVITSIQFTLAGMSAFDVLIILVLIAGGIGIFLSSFRGAND